MPLFADDFDVSVPRGVDFSCRGREGAFPPASVLVRHRATRTLHVDDTLMFLRMPFFLRLFG